MRVAPFHSIELGAAAIWHDDTDCAIGQRIPPARRGPGAGALAVHCPSCTPVSADRAYRAVVYLAGAS